MRLRVLLLAAPLLLAACATTAPPASDPVPEVAASDSTRSPSPVSPDPTTVNEPMPSETEETGRLGDPTPVEEPVVADSVAVPDPLYEETEDALRLAFTDGMFGLYRAETNPSDLQRLDRAEIQAWLTDLALVSPRAVEFARAQLGPVLEQRFVVAFLLENAAQVECASIRDVLYVPVPERFQGPDRAFTGYIIQDACDISTGDLAPFCAGGFGTTEAGTSCSCTCTTGEAPAQPCVSC